MIKLKGLITEKISYHDRVFIEGDTLWISYAPGSGNTHQLTDYKKSFSNHPKMNYEVHTLKLIKKWAETQKPVAKKKTNSGLMAMYKIPVYPSVRQLGRMNDNRSAYNRLDVFANDLNSDSSRPDLHVPKDEIVTTKKFAYILLVTEGKYDYIHWFKTRNEAVSWFKSTMNNNGK